MADQLYELRDGRRVFVGPTYTLNSTALQKHRRAARKGGLSTMSNADRHAYGEAVEKAVLTAQRASLSNQKPMPRSMSASGTYHNNGEDIERAVRARQRAALLACKSRIATMEESKVRELYDQVMAEKRKREMAIVVIAKPKQRCRR